MSDVLDFDELRTFYYEVHKDYYPKNPILAPWGDGVFDTVCHKMKQFSFWEQEIWDLWYMYTYNAVMNYSYNADRPKYETTLVNSLKISTNKLLAVVSNKAIEQIREEMVELLNQMAIKPPTKVVEMKDEDDEIQEVKLTMHLQFMWRTREDEKVCNVCGGLNGQLLMYIPQEMPHPNCRCDFVVFEWWTDPEGHVVADRRYDIEQNKKVKGDGYAVKTAKVTSKLVDGEQITIFEVDDDGTTRKFNYKNSELKPPKKGDK